MGNCLKYENVVYSTKEELLLHIHNTNAKNTGVLKFVDLRERVTLVTENGSSTDLSYNELRQFIVDNFEVSSIDDVYSISNRLLNGEIINEYSIRTVDTKTTLSYSDAIDFEFISPRQFVVAINSEGKHVYGTTEDIKGIAASEAMHEEDGLEYRVVSVSIDSKRDLEGKKTLDSQGVNIFDYKEAKVFKEFSTGEPINDTFDEYTVAKLNELGMNLTIENTERISVFIKTMGLEYRVSEDAKSDTFYNNNIDLSIDKKRAKVISVLKADLRKVLGNGEFKVTPSEVMAPPVNMALLGIEKGDTLQDIEKDPFRYFYKKIEKNLRKSGFYGKIDAFSYDNIDIKSLTVDSFTFIIEELMITIEEFGTNSEYEQKFKKVISLIHKALTERSDRDINHSKALYIKAFNGLKQEYITTIASKRVESYNKGKVIIYNRTPSQGLQSFFAAENKIFNTNYNTTRMAEADAVAQGGDYDGDMLGSIYPELDIDGAYIAYTRYLTNGSLFSNDTEFALNYTTAIHKARTSALLTKLSKNIDERIKETAKLFKGEIEYGNIDFDSLEIKQFLKENSDVNLSKSEMINITSSLVFENDNILRNETFEKDKTESVEKYNTKLEELYLKGDSVSNRNEIAEVRKARDRALTKTSNTFSKAINNYVLDKLVSIQLDPVNSIETTIAVDSIESQKLADKVETKGNFQVSASHGAIASINVGSKAVGVVANAMSLQSMINKFLKGMDSSIAKREFAYNNGQGIELSYPNHSIEDGNIINNYITSKMLLPPGLRDKVLGEEERKSTSLNDIKAYLEDEHIDNIEDLYTEGNINTNKRHSIAVWENLSEMMTNAVDNTKLLILDKLGLDMAKIPFALTMMNAGFSLKDSVLFLKQKEITDVFEAEGKLIENIEDALKRREYKIDSQDIKDLKRLADIYSATESLTNENIEGERKAYYSNEVFKSALEAKGISHEIVDVMSGDTVDYDAKITFVKNAKEGLSINDIDDLQILDNKMNLVVSENGNTYMVVNDELIYVKNINTLLIGQNVLLDGATTASGSRVTFLNIINQLLELSNNENVADLKNTVSEFNESDANRELKNAEAKSKVNPIRTLHELHRLTEEGKLMSAVIGFKNSRNNNDFDMVKYINKINKIANGLLDTETFSIEEFIKDSNYRNSSINVYENYRMNINPFMILWNDNGLKTTLKSLQAETLLIKTNKTLMIKNELSSKMSSDFGFNDYNNLDKFIKNSAISTFFDNSKPVSYKNKNYDLSSIEGRDSLLHDFISIAYDMKRNPKYKNNVFIKNLYENDFSSNSDEALIVNPITINKTIKDINVLRPALNELADDVELFNLIKAYSLIISNSTPRSHDIYNLFNNLIVEFEEHLTDHLIQNTEDILKTSNDVLILSNNRFGGVIKGERVKRKSSGLYLKMSINGNSIDIPLSKTASYYGVPGFITAQDLKDNTLENVIHKLGYRLGHEVIVDEFGNTDIVLYYDFATGSYVSSNGERYLANNLASLNPDMKFKGESFGVKTAAEKLDAGFDAVSIEAGVVSVNFNMEEANLINLGSVKYKILKIDEVENAENGTVIGLEYIGGIPYNLVYHEILDKESLLKAKDNGIPITDYMHKTSFFNSFMKNRDGDKYLILKLEKIGARRIPMNAKRLRKNDKSIFGKNLKNKIVFSEKLPNDFKNVKELFSEDRTGINILTYKGYINYTSDKDTLALEISKKLDIIGESAEDIINKFKDLVGYNPKFKNFIYKFIEGELSEELDSEKGIFVYNNDRQAKYGIMNTVEHENALTEIEGDLDALKGINVITDGNISLAMDYGIKSRTLSSSSKITEEERKGIKGSINIIKRNISDKEKINAGAINFDNALDTVYNSDVVFFNLKNLNDIKAIKPSAGSIDLSKEAVSLLNSMILFKDIENIEDFESALDDSAGLSDNQLKQYGINSEQLSSIKDEISNYNNKKQNFDSFNNAILNTAYFNEFEIAKKLGKVIYFRTEKGEWFTYDYRINDSISIDSVPVLSKRNNDNSKTTIAVFGNQPSYILNNLGKVKIEFNSKRNETVDYLIKFDRAIDINKEPESDEQSTLIDGPISANGVSSLNVKGEILYKGRERYKDFSDVSIKGFEDFIQVESKDGILTLEKDNEVYIINELDESLINKADGFHNLKKYEDTVFRFEGKLYLANNIIKMTKSEFEYRYSTSDSKINTEIYNESQGVALSINKSGVADKIIKLGESLPMFTDNNIENVLLSSNNFSKVYHYLNNGVYDSYLATDALRKLKSDIISTYEAKNRSLGRIRDKYNAFRKKTTPEILNIEESFSYKDVAKATSGNDVVKVYIKPFYELDISSIEKVNKGIYDGFPFLDSDKIKKIAGKDSKGNLSTLGIILHDNFKQNVTAFNMVFNTMLSNKKEKFYFEIPSITQEAANGVIYNEVIKALVTSVKRNPLYKKELLDKGLISFGPNAMKAINNTDGRTSFMDINRGRVLNVINIDNLNTLSLKGRVDLSKMNMNDSTLLEMWNSMNNLPLDNTYIYNAIGDKQKALTALLEKYFLSNKSELILLMQEIGSKDLYSNRKGDYSIESSIVEIINNFNNLSFINTKPLVVNDISTTEPVLFDNIISNESISLITDKDALMDGHAVRYTMLEDGSVKVIRPFSTIKIDSETNINEYISKYPHLKTKLSAMKDDAIETGEYTSVTLAYIENVDIEIKDNKAKLNESRAQLSTIVNDKDKVHLNNATIFLPLLANGTDIEFNESHILKDIASTIGNAVDLNASKDDVVWVKSTSVNEVSKYTQKHAQDVFKRSEPIIRYYISKNVKFALSEDLGANLFIKNLLENNGYSYDEESKLYKQGQTVDNRGEIKLYKKTPNSSISFGINSSLVEKGSNGIFGNVFSGTDTDGTEYTIKKGEGFFNMHEPANVDFVNEILDINSSLIQNYNDENADRIFKKALSKEKKFINMTIFLSLFPNVIDIESTPANMYSAMQSHLKANGDSLTKFNNELTKLDLTIAEEMAMVGSHLNTVSIIRYKLGLEVKKITNKYKGLNELNETGFKQENLLSKQHIEELINTEITIGELYMIASAINENVYKDYNNRSVNTSAISQKFIDNGIDAITFGNDSYVLFNDFNLKTKQGVAVENIMSQLYSSPVNVNSLAYRLKKNEKSASIGNMILRTRKKHDVNIIMSKETDGKHDVIYFKEFNGSLTPVALYDIKKKTTELVIETLMDRIGNKNFNLTKLKSSDLARNINSFYKGSKSSYSDIGTDRTTYLLFNAMGKEFNPSEDVLDEGSVFKIHNKSGDKISVFIYENNKALDRNGNYYEYKNGEFELVEDSLVFNKTKNTAAIPVNGNYSSIVVLNSGEIKPEVIEGNVRVDKTTQGTFSAKLTIGEIETEFYYDSISNIWVATINEKADLVVNTPIGLGLNRNLNSSEINSDKKLKKNISLALNTGNVILVKKGTEVESNSKIIVNDAVLEFAENIWNIKSNDIVFRTDIDQIVFNNNVIEKKIVSNKMMNRVYKAFSKKYNVNINAISSMEISEFHPGLENETGFVSNGEIFINTDKATLDTPMHEFGHLYMAFLKKTNPSLYESIIVKALNNSALSEEIMKKRPDIKDANDLGEEVFVTMLGFANQTKLIKEQKWSFIKFVKELFSTIFGIKTSSFEVNEDMSLSEMVETLGNKIVYGEDSIFNDFMEKEKDAISNENKLTNSKIQHAIQSRALRSKFAHEKESFFKACN